MNETLDLPDPAAAPGSLDFLWLELTNRCNLRCVHCYAESGPSEYGSDVLQGDDYARLLDESRALGCRDVQFIGGEPTLNRDLPRLIIHARGSGYDTVEVFSNLTHLPDSLLECYRDNQVHVATSFYSARADVHDAITKRQGSFVRTVENLRRVLDAELPTRAGIIEMEQNAGETEDAIAYLRALGVERVGVDRVRKFGRANGEEGAESMSELCGHCAGRTLCVGPDGTVSPCIMAKAWPVGSVLEEPLPAIARSERVQSIRASIYAEAAAPREHHVGGGQDSGKGFGNAAPDQPKCPPYSCTPGTDPCWPSTCSLCIPRCHPAPPDCIPCPPGGIHCNPDLRSPPRCAPPG